MKDHGSGSWKRMEAHGLEKSMEAGLKHMESWKRVEACGIREEHGIA